MVFEVFRSLNSKADHLVNWDLVSLIHGGMDANQVLFLNHLVSDLRFQLKNKNNKLRHNIIPSSFLKLKKSVLFGTTKMKNGTFP